MCTERLSSARCTFASSHLRISMGPSLSSNFRVSITTETMIKVAFEFVDDFILSSYHSKIVFSIPLRRRGSIVGSHSGLILSDWTYSQSLWDVFSISSLSLSFFLPGFFLNKYSPPRICPNDRRWNNSKEKYFFFISKEKMVKLFAKSAAVAKCAIPALLKPSRGDRRLCTCDRVHHL